VAEAVNSVLRIVSGRLSDRKSGRRSLVILGYALSSAARPFIALATSWTHVLLIRAADRTGKGIRGAPRDAMLARLADASSRGRIFGFHRAMDHTGAVVGPVMATVFLFFLPGHYRTLFALTAIPGALAVATLFRVREPEQSTERSLRLGAVAARSGQAERPERPEGSLQLGAVAPRSGQAERLSSRLYVIVAIIFLFSLGSSSDAFLLLRLTDALGSVTYVPLVWAGHHVVKASLSTWGGTLSDRLGRRYVIAIGWGIYALIYLGFAIASRGSAFIVLFMVYGVHFALAEGSEKALVADLTPTNRQGTAFGLYNGVLGAGALIASVAFGFVYDRFSPAAAFGMGAALAGTAAVLLLLVRDR
jgi:MFS family permease